MTELPFASEYFATARERYWIRLRKLANRSPQPLTHDPVFREWRFCNVHREDDKTTAWFRENVRDSLANEYADYYKILHSTVAFRWFNRIETGKRILPELLGTWNEQAVLEKLRGVSPVVTGAYIIKGYDGMPKLEGVLRCIREAEPLLQEMVNMPEFYPTLESAWGMLKEVNYLGGFMAYEIVSDLRWTRLLNVASDINSWANAGPGCARGLSRVIEGKLGRFNTSPRDQKEMLQVMQRLLELSRSDEYWPQDWTKWEMREVEHWSCEFDKYQRVAIDGERMKQRYRPS